MAKMRGNMGKQLKDLTQAVAVGQKYLDEFVSDNQISEAFYKYIYVFIHMHHIFTVTTVKIYLSRQFLPI